MRMGISMKTDGLADCRPSSHLRRASRQFGSHQGRSNPIQPIPAYSRLFPPIFQNGEPGDTQSQANGRAWVATPVASSRAERIGAPAEMVPWAEAGGTKSQPEAARRAAAAVVSHQSKSNRIQPNPSETKHQSMATEGARVGGPRPCEPNGNTSPGLPRRGGDGRTPATRVIRAERESQPKVARRVATAVASNPT